MLLDIVLIITQWASVNTCYQKTWKIENAIFSKSAFANRKLIVIFFQ